MPRKGRKGGNAAGIRDGRGAPSSPKGDLRSRGNPGARSPAGAVGFTTGQVARYCFVTSDTIVNWIHAGSLPAQRTPGGQHRILLADLLAFQRAHGMSTALVEAEQSVRPYCWEFHCTGDVAEGCRACLVHRAGALDCWALGAHVDRRQSQQPRCEGCEYHERFLTATDEET